MSADPDVSAGLRAGTTPLDGVMARAGVDAGLVHGTMTAPLRGDQRALDGTATVPAPDEIPPAIGQTAAANGQGAPVNVQSAAANAQGGPAKGQSAAANGQSGPANGHASMGSEAPAGCTAAQLRRFIKSRAYVPMHELRRRFELNGEADDVSPVVTQHGLIYLGLPTRESQLIGELVRQGEVGVELCRDPRVPIVVGVYPMRPITRQ